MIPYGARRTGDARLEAANATQARRPVVSVCCVTYNHAPYIADALEGFLAQKCDFPFEVLIYDDASNDGTADIVRAYAERYPEVIFPIFQTVNQYSLGVRTYRFNLERVRGEFVAFCDGDDYWTCPTKLARQVAAARESGCGLVFHPARKVRDGVDDGLIGVYGRGAGQLPVERIIERERGMIPTAACLISRRAADRLTEFMAARAYLTMTDVYLQILGALEGGALYLDEVMSVYRYRLPGSWNARMKQSRRAAFMHACARVRSFEELDALTGHRYRKHFVRANNKWIRRAVRRTGAGFSERVRLLGKLRFPF